MQQSQENSSETKTFTKFKSFYFSWLKFFYLHFFLIGTVRRLIQKCCVRPTRLSSPSFVGLLHGQAFSVTDEEEVGLVGLTQNFSIGLSLVASADCDPVGIMMTYN